jgi:copper chaperone CopZ
MLRYQVDDLNCGHCIQALTQAVKGVDPAAVATIDDMPCKSRLSPGACPIFPIMLIMRNL